jgi:hypothetical protein
MTSHILQNPYANEGNYERDENDITISVGHCQR